MFRDVYIVMSVIVLQCNSLHGLCLQPEFYNDLSATQKVGRGILLELSNIEFSNNLTSEAMRR